MTYTLTRHLTARGYPVETETRRWNIRTPTGALQFPNGTDAATARVALGELNRPRSE